MPGDVGTIPEWGRSPAEGNGNALQYSCLENSTDREAWQPAIQRSQRVGHNWATKRTIAYYIMQVLNIFHWLQIHFHWESLTSSLLSWIFLPFFPLLLPSPLWERSLTKNWGERQKPWLRLPTLPSSWYVGNFRNSLGWTGAVSKAHLEAWMSSRRSIGGKQGLYTWVPDKKLQPWQGLRAALHLRMWVHFHSWMSEQ